MPARHGRRFTAPDGTHWSVWEVSSQFLDTQVSAERSVPAQLAEGWLCFESSGDRRRLAPVPIGWQELTECQIYALCERATPVRATESGSA